MENKINIAEILRDMPKGTKLYSPLFGKCKLVGVDTDEDGDFICVETFFQDERVRESRTFSSDGRYFGWYEDAKCILFPSDRMRCWSKFFKRGDVVFNESSGLVAVFDGWVSDDYAEFNTTINLIKKSDFWGEEEVCLTECFSKATDEERAKFIAAAEKHYGGKYNPETLQVEPAKVVEPKCSFKPFQEVLVRNSDADIWIAAHFSRYNNKNPYCYITTLSAYKQCVSYEGNQHLLGTTNNPK